jgi:hypothetical protein
MQIGDGLTPPRELTIVTLVLRGMHLCALTQQHARRIVSLKGPILSTQARMEFKVLEILFRLAL